MRRVGEFYFKAVAIGVLLIAVAISWFYLSIASFADTPLKIAGEGTVYVVQPGEGLIKVAQALKKQGLIDNARHFVWFARFHGEADEIKVGEYELTNGMTPRELLQDLIEGKVKQYSVTIIEGWTFKQVLASLQEHNKIRHTLNGLSTQEIADRMGIENGSPEGWLLPDTYHFPATTTDIEFLKRAYMAMRNLLDKEWPARDGDLPYDTPYEALIMASIVEKETGVSSERGEIAGVFTRRLHKHMRLQTDPTVIYGMGDKYKGNIKKGDLKRDTPYNTYTRGGLPPTPIAMPSADAIKAALHPTPGTALYFVAKGDGSHHFSTTIEEHNKAVRTYQIKRRKKDYRSAPVNES